jgi:hypothetical protein
MVERELDKGINAKGSMQPKKGFNTCGCFWVLVTQGAPGFEPDALRSEDHSTIYAPKAPIRHCFS